MSDKSLRTQLQRSRVTVVAAPQPVPFPRAPGHLGAPERRLWRDLGAGFSGWDSAGLAVLRSALESHQRARQAREVIDQQGAATTDRFGQVRAHPLLAVERDSRAAFTAGVRALRLLEPNK